MAPGVEHSARGAEAREGSRQQEIRLTITAMASSIHVVALGSMEISEFESDVRRACEVFVEVERACSRFDTESDLMVANRFGQDLVRVAPLCYASVVAAYEAYRLTEGSFDPRVLKDLEGMGYVGSFPMGDGTVEMDGRAPIPRDPLPPWAPVFDKENCSVGLGEWPIDLGGIGKGLSVGWCAERLANVSNSFLVEAGGDCYGHGNPADDNYWQIGIEHPVHPERHLAILRLRDRACATSSSRVRRWKVKGEMVHHLIDPRTGLSGGEGILAVTVVHPDPALAEVWSKALFLEGASRIGARAERLGLAAFWVYDNESFEFTSALEEHISWIGG